MLLIASTSCQKVLDINKDPNNPSSANPEQLLPAAQVELATSLGNNYAFLSSMWAQYWTNGTVVSATPVEFFTLVGGDVNGSYSRVYFRSLQDLSELIKGNQPIYAGMAKILSAYIYQQLVDLHGDVPFSEALKGDLADGGIVTPKFDKASDVYAALIPLIDDGVDNLNATGATVKKPGDDDLIYKGNIANWIAFANTLKLKILTRQSIADPTKKIEAQDLLTSGITFIDGSNSAQIEFSGSSKGYNNPLFARFESRDATKMYYRASQTSLRILNTLNDPRIVKIYKPGTDAIDNSNGGIEQGESNNVPYKATANTKYAEPNPTYVYNAATPYFLISPWESKFLQAEILNDSTLWAQAIDLSFSYYEVTSSLSDYINNLPAGYTWTNNSLKAIAIQKWISMNGLQMTEGWIETRRFDSPLGIIFRGVGGIFHSPSESSLGTNNFPSLFVYPNTEVQYNPNTPSRVVTDKVFWDN